MYEIAICDDDIVFSSTFEKLLSQLLDEKKASYRLTHFSDPDSLRQAIEQGKTYNLIFLDILFDSEKGIHFAHFLRNKRYNTDIIFMSTTSDYAVSSYDVSALYYLEKPIDQKKMEAALDRFFEKNTMRSLHFTTSRGILHIQIDDILYFEIYSHRIVIHKADGTKETCTGTLKELENLLPSLTFVRPHRSYLVNFGHISEIIRYQIRLSSGDIIPISKNLYRHVQDNFIKYADKNCLSF